MDTGVAGPIITLTNISNFIWDYNIHTKKMGGKYCGNFHIYGTIAIFLLFCDYQDTGYVSQETEIGVSAPIFIKKIPTA